MLRAAAGVIAVLEGVAYLNGGVNSLGARWFPAVLGIAIGAFLLMGLLTAFAAALVALGTLGIALSWLPAPTGNLLETRVVTILVIIVASSVVLLGPGALSFDARLFGRREIIIPRSSISPEP